MTLHDKELIKWNNENAYIKVEVAKKFRSHIIDINIDKQGKKRIAIDKIPVKKINELIGMVNVVYFSPDEMDIVKESPVLRRNFLNISLSQQKKSYYNTLVRYNKVLAQRNKLLKDLFMNPDLRDTLNIWDSQLLSFGSKIIERRQIFVSQLNEIIYDIHKKLSGEKEELVIKYEPDVTIENYEKKLSVNQERDIRLKQTSTGPHRDDFSFIVNDVDIRKFGSQGQQRTAALSLKLSEIELVKKITKDTPVLLLDDVLSELDSNRQNHLLNSIGDIQTIITCTGLDEFVNNRFEINRVFNVQNGVVERK